MLGRFLQGLKECIERIRGDHVDLVYYIYLIRSLGGSICYFLAYLPYIIDTSVGSCVDLDNVHKASVKDALTCGALVTGIAVDGRFTVDGS